MRALVFEVPLPPRALSPNGGGAGSRRWAADAVAAYRLSVKLDALQAIHDAGGWEVPLCARVGLLWAIKGAKGRYYMPRDSSNACSAFKAGYDGLRDAGLIIDDNWEHMELGSVRCDKSAGPFVRVTVEALP